MQHLSVLFVLIIALCAAGCGRNTPATSSQKTTASEEKRPNPEAQLYQAFANAIADEKQRETVEKMAESPDAVHARGLTGETPLIAACMLNKPDIARLLIEKGADVNARSNRNGTALTNCDDPELAKLLIEKGAAVNAQGLADETALHLAIRDGMLELARVLLENGADPTIANDRGETALHYAVDWDQPDIIKALLAEGADVTLENRNGQTPLDIARTKDGTVMANMLRPPSRETD